LKEKMGIIQSIAHQAAPQTIAIPNPVPMALR
ncbi:unnamed protein product, partial [marine sediment metagenome]